LHAAGYHGHFYDLRMPGMEPNGKYTVPVGIEEKQRVERGIATWFTKVGLIVLESKRFSKAGGVILLGYGDGYHRDIT